METTQYNEMNLTIYGTNYSITTLDPCSQSHIISEFNIIHEHIVYNIKPSFKKCSFTNAYQLYVHYKRHYPCSILEVYCKRDVLFTDMNIIGELYHGRLSNLSIPIHYICYIIHTIDNITYHIAIDTSLRCKVNLQFYVETSYDKLIQLLQIRYLSTKIKNSIY
jgi:hypothetical protein